MPKIKHIQDFPSNTIFKNLVITTTAAKVVTVNADVLHVGSSLLVVTDKTASLLVSGVGGLDTGTAASNTWYYVFIITDNTGAMVGTLISLSATNPNLPSGYTLKRRIGSFKTTSGSVIIPFTQINEKVLFNEMLNYTSVLTDGVATTDTVIDLSSYVPSISTRAILFLNARAQDSGGSTEFDMFISKSTTPSSNPTIVIACITPVATIPCFNSDINEMDITSDQKVYYAISQAPDTSGGLSVFVYGYYDNKI